MVHLLKMQVLFQIALKFFFVMEFNVKCLFLQENSMGGKCIIECVTCACVCIYVFLQTSLNSCFLSRYVLNESQSRQNSSSAQGSSSNSGGGSGIPQPPPGMSFYAAKRVIGDNPWTPEQLEQVANTACFPWNLTLHPRPAASSLWKHGSPAASVFSSPVQST